MKKISTLALALIAMGSLSMPASAQVNFEPVSTPTLESGWYQMRQVVGVSRKDISATAPRYVYSADALGKNYTWFGTDASQKTDATAFVYVHKNGSNYAIKNINGKWGSSMAKYTDGNAEPSYAIKQDASNNTQFQVGGTWDDWLDWNYMGGASNEQAKAARFEFSKVGETALAAYDVYAVSIIGDATTGSVTSTNTANKGTKTVYNGGSYFFTAGTSISESDFTIPDVACCTKTVAFDASAKTLTVNYTLDESLITKAENVLGKIGIGYPTATSVARTNLSKAITNAKASKTLANYNTLSSAYTAYLTTSEVQMPEDGKAYTFTAEFIDGATYYMDYAEDGYKLQETKSKNNSDYPVTATLVCRKVGDKYTFANNAGKYIVWRSSSKGDETTALNKNKGYVDAYGENVALTIEKATKTGNYIANKETADFFGYVFIKGYRAVQKVNDRNPYFVFTVNNGAYKYNAGSSPYYKDGHSSLIKIEETTYPNTVTFNTVSDVEGVSNLATFSAPFATVVPEGVTAYYVSTADNTKATMKAIEAGKAIPAKAGVILTSTTGEEATMIPATTETAADLTGNKLGNSAGAAKTIAEGDNAYILAGGTDGTAFYKGKVGTTLGINKAYLTFVAVSGGEQAISMNFGGNVTGINQIVNAEQNNAPVYDLTGRRVVRTVKGGLYIKGGNKFIAR